MSYKVIGIIETSFQNIYPHEGTIFAGLQIKAATLRREHTWSKRPKRQLNLKNTCSDRLPRLAWSGQQRCILRSKDYGECRPQGQGAIPLLFSSANSKETARGKHFFVFWWLWSRCNGGWVVKFLHPEITNYVTRPVRKNPLEECSTAFNPLEDIS